MVAALGTEIRTDEELENLVNAPEAAIWRQKAEYCISLYRQGLKYEAWTPLRAKFWFMSIIYFVNHFMSPEFPIPKFHKRWYYWSVSEQSYMNLAPRDHAKTTVHSVYRVVWEICMNRNITFLLIFSTGDIGKLVLSLIKSQLTQNERVLMGFGLFNPTAMPHDERTVDRDWSQTSITVNRDDFNLKDPTVAITGSLTNVLSRRVHRLYVDDLLTDKIAHSESESTRLERWYFNDVNPALRADGQELITGTLYKRGDFYHGIMDMAKSSASLNPDGESVGLYKVFVGDAILDEISKRVLWPERWSYASLMRQRLKLGSVKFNRNYRNRVMADSDSTFPMIWFTGGMDEETQVIYRGCLDEKLTMGNSNRLVIQKTLFGIDPAIGTTKASKYFALVVLGLDMLSRLIVLDIVREKLSFVAQKRMMAQKYEIWRPRYIVVESNGYQKALAQGMDEEYPHLPIRTFFTASSGERKPEIGVPSMDIYFETGRVRIPYGDPQSRRKADQLVEELHYWGAAETSDVAMALWFPFMMIRKELESATTLRLLQGGMKRSDYELDVLLRGASGRTMPRNMALRARELAIKHNLGFGASYGRRPAFSSILDQIKKNQIRDEGDVPPGVH